MDIDGHTTCIKQLHRIRASVVENVCRQRNNQQTIGEDNRAGANCCLRAPDRIIVNFPAAQVNIERIRIEQFGPLRTAVGLGHKLVDKECGRARERGGRAQH